MECLICEASGKPRGSCALHAPTPTYFVLAARPEETDVILKESGASGLLDWKPLGGTIDGAKVDAKLMGAVKKAGLMEVLVLMMEGVEAAAAMDRRVRGYHSLTRKAEDGAMQVGFMEVIGGDMTWRRETTPKPQPGDCILLFRVYDKDYKAPEDPDICCPRCCGYQDDPPAGHQHKELAPWKPPQEWELTLLTWAGWPPKGLAAPKEKL